MDLITARRYDTLRPVAVQLEADRIASICPAADAAHLPWVAPGLVDLQLNGYGGIEFNAPQLTVGDVARVVAAVGPFGVTQFFPTLTTDAWETHARSLQTLRAACEELREVRDAVAGVHLEGPYISAEDGPRGAHPRQHVFPPDWDAFARLQEAAGGLIRLVTLSPEYAAAPAFIARAAATGVVVAIGHTNATSDQIRAAVEAGASLSTHLGNGAHPQIRRHPNYIWDQLAEDRLTASLISDGRHLPPAVVKSMTRAKTPDRIFLVSDATSLAGLPPGRYETGLGAVEMLPDGRLVVAGQHELLAGASDMLPHCIECFVRFADVDWRTALDCAGKRPARIAGITNHELTAGATADLVLFDPPLSAGGRMQIVRTIRRGRVVFDRR